MTTCIYNKINSIASVYGDSWIGTAYTTISICTSHSICSRSTCCYIYCPSLRISKICSSMLWEAWSIGRWHNIVSKLLNIDTISKMSCTAGMPIVIIIWMIPFCLFLSTITCRDYCDYTSIYHFFCTGNNTAISKFTFHSTVVSNISHITHKLWFIAITGILYCGSSSVKCISTTSWHCSITPTV